MLYYTHSKNFEMSSEDSRTISFADEDDVADVADNSKDTGDVRKSTYNFFDSLEIKHAILLLIMFIMLHSVTYITRVLSNVKGAVVYDKITDLGIFISGIILSISSMFFSIVIKNNWL